MLPLIQEEKRSPAILLQGIDWQDFGAYRFLMTASFQLTDN
jgi:hypothetical protein